MPKMSIDPALFGLGGLVLLIWQLSGLVFAQAPAKNAIDARHHDQSSHALIGGILGAGVAAFGMAALILPPATMVEQLAFYSLIGAITGAIFLGILASYLKEAVQPALVLGAIFSISVTIPLLMMAGVLVLTGILAIVVFIFISPIIGFFTAFLFDLLVSHLFRYSRQNRMKRIFQPLQVAASLYQAAGHGANDGQHAVGVITALLLAGGLISSFVGPLWVVVVSATAIAPDIYVYDLQSGAARRLTADGTLNERPEWSPGGDRILYKTDRGGPRPSLWWMPADGSGTAEQLVASAGKDIWQGMLSPDGKTVIYRTGGGGTGDYLVRIRGKRGWRDVVRHRAIQRTRAPFFS